MESQTKLVCDAWNASSSVTYTTLPCSVKVRTHHWPRGPQCVFKHAEPASIFLILSSYHLNSLFLLLQTLAHTQYSHPSSSSSSFLIIITKWLAKERVLQGNHPPELVGHLLAIKPHKKLRDSKPQLMRKGDRYSAKGR
ncbi:hypothetical protein PIB30_087911 [Stylosanthes scabra]|uniref:Uncharacterized protein n=1 Tax=Stylosanthes scabra TaxID=79078 RepID=A0ABU6UW34_9FABA|nr:hypothetical protein [Stylosanthes scabra]